MTDCLADQPTGPARWQIQCVDPDPDRHKAYWDSVHYKVGFAAENLQKIPSARGVSNGSGAAPLGLNSTVPRHGITSGFTSGYEPLR